MEFDKEKVDETTLALLYLVIFDEKHGPFAWKGLPIMCTSLLSPPWKSLLKK